MTKRNKPPHKAARLWEIGKIDPSQTREALLLPPAPPAGKRRVLFIEPNNDRYDESLLAGPLGGSETCFLFLTRELRSRPDIELITWFRNDGDLKAMHGDDRFDMVISYRDPAPLAVTHGIWNCLWLQDLLPEQDVLAMYHLLATGKINKLLMLSQFQKAYFTSGVAVDERRHILLLENPLDLALFDASIPKEKAFIYASAPNRGLDVLLEMWPAIHSQLPDWGLRIAGSTTMYNVGQQADNPDRQRFLSAGLELYARAATMPGVHLLGGLSHRDLVIEMEKAAGLLYPSTFPETSCHTLNTALHAGAVPFVSFVGALPEKVLDSDNGYVTPPGDSTTPEWQAQYVAKVVAAVESGAIWELSKRNRGRYNGWSAKKVIDQLLTQTIDNPKIAGRKPRMAAIVCTRADRGPRTQCNFANLTWFGGLDVQQIDLPGLPIDMARNAAANMTIESGSDWLLFLDDDIFVDRLFIQRMLKRAKDHSADIVVANYCYKETGIIASTWNVLDRTTNMPVDVYEEGLRESQLNGPDARYVLTSAGAGALMISTDALKELGRPWFRSQHHVGDRTTGEDTYFFINVLHAGLKMYAALDEPVIHVDNDTGIAYGKPADIKLIWPQVRRWFEIEAPVAPALTASVMPGMGKEEATAREIIAEIEAGMKADGLVRGEGVASGI